MGDETPGTVIALTRIWAGLVPSFQSRWESAYTAGPWTTLPSMLNCEPWHGQSKRLASAVNATEQPRWEQLIARTESLPARSFTA